MHTAPTRLIRSGAISASTLTNIAVVAIVVCALYFGRQILVPVALAILLSFVLSPPVRLLQGKYFPRGAAVGVVALLAFVGSQLSPSCRVGGDLSKSAVNLWEPISVDLVRALMGACAPQPDTPVGAHLEPRMVVRGFVLVRLCWSRNRPQQYRNRRRIVANAHCCRPPLIPP